MEFQYTILTFVDSFFTLLTLKKTHQTTDDTNSLSDARSDCTDSYNGPKSLRQAWPNPVCERPLISRPVAIRTLRPFAS